MSERTPNVLILGSGGGSTAQRVIEDIASDDEGVLDMNIVGVVTDVEGAGILSVAARANSSLGLDDIPTYLVNSDTHPKGAVEDSEYRTMTDEESNRVLQIYDALEVDVIALLGYMKMVRGPLHDELGQQPEHTSPYQSRIMNNHPGYLTGNPEVDPKNLDSRGLYGAKPTYWAFDMHRESSAVSFITVAAGYDCGYVVEGHEVALPEEDRERFEIARSLQEMGGHSQKQASAIMDSIANRVFKEQVQAVEKEHSAAVISRFARDVIKWAED